MDTDTWHASAGGVFVCGSPFTEVSTLAWALAEHAAFWTSSESRFLYRLFGSRADLERPYLYDLYTTCNQDGAWLRANAVSYPAFLAALGEGIAKLFQARAGKKRRWVDNSPENALLLDELLLMFPDASFVGLLQPLEGVGVHHLQLGRAQDTVHSFFACCESRSVRGEQHSMTTALSAYSCSSFDHYAWLTPW